MKKLFLISLLTLIATSSFADDQTIQLGADLVVPYRVDSPDSRLATMVGAHGKLFLNDSFAVSMETLFGVEDQVFADKPVYFIPGVSFYIPFVLNPFFVANVPVLLNNGQDFGVQGGAGVLWNIIVGLGLQYSIDVAYYFDSNATIVNWAHFGAVFTW